MFQSQFYFIYKDINNLLIAMSFFFSHSCVEQAKHDHTFIQSVYDANDQKYEKKKK